jgi:hypothetical protein
MWFFVAAIHLIQNLPNFAWKVIHRQREDAEHALERYSLQRSVPFYARPVSLEQDRWAQLRQDLGRDHWQLARQTLLCGYSLVKAVPFKPEERADGYPPPRWLQGAVPQLDATEIPAELRRAR